MIYHFSVRVHKKYCGRKVQNIVGAAAYCSGSKLSEKGSKKVFNFTKKEGVVYSEIISPISNCKDSYWFYEREKLWNEVEKIEEGWRNKRSNNPLIKNLKRALSKQLEPAEKSEVLKEFSAWEEKRKDRKYKSHIIKKVIGALSEEQENKENKRDALNSFLSWKLNSQLAREIIVALPKELNLEQQKNLLKEYLQKYMVDNGMIADFSIHHDNPNNPHAHILLTMRTLKQNESGEILFGKKERSWNKRDLISKWRKGFADITNNHLKQAGIEERVDHRSNFERGLLREPSIHLGKKNTNARKEGRVLGVDLINKLISEFNKQKAPKGSFFENDLNGLSIKDFVKSFYAANKEDVKNNIEILRSFKKFKNSKKDATRRALLVGLINEYDLDNMVVTYSSTSSVGILNSERSVLLINKLGG